MREPIRTFDIPIRDSVEKHLEKQKLKAETKLEAIKLPEYKPSRLEKLQHKLRHVPTVLGGLAGIGAGIAVKTGQIGWALILGGVSAVLTPFRIVAEQQTKYGDKGKFEKKDWLQILIDILNLILKRMKG